MRRRAAEGVTWAVGVGAWTGGAAAASAALPTITASATSPQTALWSVRRGIIGSGGALHHPVDHLVEGIEVGNGQIGVRDVDVEGFFSEHAEISQREGVDQPAGDQRLVVLQRIAGV